MKHLSPESIDFLKRIKIQNNTESKKDNWGQQNTKLFSDLYDIIGQSVTGLKDFALGKWNIIYNDTDDDRSLVYEFALSQSKDLDKLVINITIAPFGQSTIEITHAESLCPVDAKSFYQSSTYHRYFEPHQSKTDGLMTVISQKQITSRHLGAYLEHLLTMMKPYLRAACAEVIKERPAA